MNDAGPPSVVPITNVSALAASLLTLGVLLKAWTRVRGTTLTGPWAWSLLAVAGLAFVALLELCGPSLSPGTADKARYVTAAATVCPLMSLLGARRPHHRAWHFVVAALWGLLALPAAEALLVRRGAHLALDELTGWLLWLLILLGPSNFVGTRYLPAALLVAIGQVLMLSGHLPLIPWEHRQTLWAAGTAIPATAALLAAHGQRSTRFPHQRDRLWLDFRDTFGAAWALRIQDRFNHTAETCGWQLRLTWRGFRDRSTGRPADITAQPAAVRRCFASLIRRFVSPEWVEIRCPLALPSTGRM